MSVIDLNALALAYKGSGSRNASGVSSVADPTDIADFLKAEALSSPEDCLIAIGLAGNLYNKRLADLKFGTKTLADISVDYKAQDKDTQNFCNLIGGMDPVNVGSISSYYASSVNWMTELVMCYQVKPLNRDNVKNYFRGCGLGIGSTTFILKFLKVASAKLGSLVEVDELRNKAILNKFVRNHTSYASSGGLVMRAYEELGKFGDIVFDGNDIKEASAARDSPYSVTLAEKVSERSKVVAYIYLDVNGALPENWYQGTAAYEAAPPATKRILKTAFKKLAAVTVDTTTIDAAGTYDELAAAIPSTLRFK